MALSAQLRKLITEYQVHQDQVLSGLYFKKDTLEKIIVKNILKKQLQNSHKTVQRTSNPSSSPAISFETFCSQNYSSLSGDTLNELVLYLPSSKREHVHYVALSRLRSISGLHILNMNENKIAGSKRMQEEMERLRQKATLNSHIPFLEIRY